jgi:4-hydroxy-3-methylbut-2-enyl diphosphate reductase
MKILRAIHLGMCFGVRDAIELARQTAGRESVTVLGQLVHNQTVLAELQREGVRFADQPAEVRTQTILITAHGASDKRLAAAKATGRNVIEATCPLVHHAHRELRMLLAARYHPVIIGKRGHVEVRGLTEDLAECDIVLSEGDVATLKERSKFGVVAQTTQPVERVQRLTALIRERFPDSEVLLRDTVCRPTKERQEAAVELAQRCDVVVVIGGANSNNTHELVATCRRHCDRVHHIQSAADVQPSWFEPEDTVGLTAGTSTPDQLIEGVEKQLRELVLQIPQLLPA